MMGEVSLPELVFDETIGRRGVRNPQERFGQHHQGKPLLRRQRVFAQDVVDAAEPAFEARIASMRSRARPSIRASRSALSRALDRKRAAMRPSSSA
jgi:hypothetical protein